MNTTELTVREALRTLIGAASPSRRRLFVVTLGLMLLGALAELATIGAVLPFLALVTAPERAQEFTFLVEIGNLLGGGTSGLIYAGAALLVSVAIAAGLIRFVLTWINLRFILLYGHDLGVQIFGRLLRQPYGDFVTRNSSVALSSIDKLNTVVFSVLMPLMQGLAAAVISLFITIGLLFIDPIAASIAAVSLGSTYLVVSLLTKARLRRNALALGTASTERVKVVQEGLGGLRDILLDNSQHVYETSFARLDYRYRSALVVNNMIALAPRFLIETAVIVMIAIITIYFAQLPGGLIGAVPILGALAIGAQRLLPLVHLAYNGWTGLTGNSQLIVDIAELLRIRTLSSTESAHRAVPLPFERKISLHHVGFSYQTSAPALRDVSFSISRGERIGFVGRTGSGKSTLIDLLMGLLPVTEGEVRIDDVVLDDEIMPRWQAQIAHVPQTIYLSDGTIASNIAFGTGDGAIDLDRVRKAAESADIHEFIMSQPDGYQATVGERGVRLSGGQRQRIGIARALYKGAKVLVFDEATSALDENTEAAIMNSIYRLNRDVTLLMIAHRLSTLSGCDRIVHLDEGRITKISELDHAN